MRTRTLLETAAVATVAGLVGMAAAPVAGASTAATLPLTAAKLQAMVVDQVHRHVFLSDGANVYVTDFSGTLVATVAEPGAGAMALSPDSGALYVALNGNLNPADTVPYTQIVTVDTTSFAPTGTRNTGMTEPGRTSMVQIGGKLWFNAGLLTSAGWKTGIGVYDPSTPSMGNVFTPTTVPADLLSVNPAAPGVLVVAGAPATAGAPNIGVYDVSNGTLPYQPTAAASVPDVGAPRGRSAALAVSADGRQIVLADGDVLRTSDLTSVGRYLSPVVNGALTSVWLAPDGTVAFAGPAPTAAGQVPGVDLFVFAPGASHPLNTYAFPSSVTAGALSGEGVAWDPDGSRIFTLVLDASGDAGTLGALDSPEVAATAIALSAPAQDTLGQALTAHGTLGSGAALAPGTTVTVTRSDAASPAGTTVATVPVAADGSFSFTDTPPVAGAATYTAQYAGDAAHKPTTTSATVQVNRLSTTLTVTTDAAAYAYGGWATVTAHLGTTPTGRTVSLYAQPYGGARTLVATGTVDARGDLTARYRAWRTTTLTAVFAGDDRYAPATATRQIADRVSLAEALKGYYRSVRYGSIWVRDYHHSAKPVLTASVTPKKPGQCMVFDLERYDGGAWHNLGATPCIKINAAGTASITVVRTMPTGLYRIDAAYLAARTDPSNASTPGAWQFFAITN
ncbi:type II secretory pathway pseudopilin PulG [Streptacidiphilus sp. MAP12-33]|uniref:Ig-like domain-containing protein n=1 Tax=Streptacidiphilus sp. MAP12-33 TaxID=3156266 RepID=UPI0035138C9A